MDIKQLITVIIGAVILASCNKDREVDIQYQLTANVDVSEMFRGIKDGTRNDVFTGNSKDYIVTINYMVYDEAGKLIYRDDEESVSLFRKFSFSAALNEGNYTAVVWAWSRHVLDSGVVPWISANENSLHTLKIVSNNVAPVGVAILGVSKTGIAVNKVIERDIAVRSAGACYMLNFVFPPETGANYIRLKGNMHNHEYFVESEEASVIVSNTNSSWEKNDNIAVSAEELLWCVPVFFLPATQQNFELMWETFDGQEQINAQILTFSSVEQGKHQLIDINTETGDVAVTPTNE
jgi:hypothetical protein